MRKKITIVDYGSGNLLSAQQSFIKAAKLIGIDAEIQISNNPKNLELSTHVVLPGQGALSQASHDIQRAATGSTSPRRVSFDGDEEAPQGHVYYCYCVYVWHAG